MPAGVQTEHMASDRSETHAAARLEHRIPPWIGDVAAAVAIVCAAFAPFPGAEFRPAGPLAVAVVVAPAVLLPFRRRWPVPVLAAVIALYGIAAFVGTLSPGVVLAAAVAMFAVANRSNRRRAIVAAGLAVGAVVLLGLLASIGSVFDPRSLQFAVTIAFAAAAGDATRSRREYIVAVTERAERAEQSREAEAVRRVTEERLRIARDLHDAVAHRISVISLNAGVASRALATRPEKAEEALRVIRSAARTVLGEIGDLLEVLRSEDAAAGRSAEPLPGLDRLDALVAQFEQAGLRVGVRLDGDVSAITGTAGTVAYRVIQEGLTNAHKHGAHGRAHVLIDARGDEATIVVTNPVPPPARDGRGGRARDAGGGHGLLGIRERVASVRGSVEAGITPGGFRLAVTLPLTPGTEETS